MSEQDRRTFLKTAAGALPGAAVAGSLGLGACGPQDDADTTGSRPASNLPAAPLHALASVTLPASALGETGTDDAVRGFLEWVEGFEPAAELDHPYLTGELRYALPHPGPRWAAQLEALDLESSHRSGLPFAELPEAGRQVMIELALRGESSPGLPGNPAQANHVAVGLLAWFYGTSGANDLCYGARVGRHTCRGIDGLPGEPSAVEGP